MQQELEMDKNEADEKCLSEVKLFLSIKKEFDAEMIKEHYPPEWIITVYDNIKTDQRTMFIQQKKLENMDKYNKNKNIETNTTTIGDSKPSYPVSEKQKKFIKDLGGDPNKPKDWKEASRYIEELQKMG